jgi:hypothetical protein
MSLFGESCGLRGEGDRLEDGLGCGLDDRLIGKSSKLRSSKGDLLRRLMFRRLSKLIDRTGVIVDGFIFLVD